MFKLVRMAAWGAAFFAIHTHAAPMLTGYEKVWTLSHGNGFNSEIPAYDAQTNTLWVAGVTGIDVLNLATGGLVTRIDTSQWGNVNSVSIKNGIAALAIENSANRTLPGTVKLFDTTSRSLLSGVNSYTVGALPDMLTFTPDGSRLLVANEGTPNTYGTRIGTSVPRVYGAATGDPVGSVSIIDFSSASVSTLNLTGIPEFGSFIRKHTGMDFEPEYIAISPDSKTAFITLQEANALAVLDLERQVFERIVGLGAKNFALPGNEIDPRNDGTVNFIQANALGLYMPDGIQAYTVGGQTYLVMANEGDFREDDADRSAASSLGAVAPLDRLRISNTESSAGNLYAAGARSFSIRDAQGNLIYDSGSILDREAANRGIYNDDRSRDKGVEPEDVALLDLGGRVYAFIGLERTTQGAVAIFDISNPFDVSFIDMIVTAGDLAPEGIKAFRAGQDYFLAIANEVSNTTSLYRLNAVPEPASLALMVAGLGLMGTRLRRIRPN